MFFVRGYGSKPATNQSAKDRGQAVDFLLRPSNQESRGHSKIGFMVLKTHGSPNVPIEHHPTIRYMVYNGYYKVMSNIPKMGHLPTPETADGTGISQH